MTPEPVIQVEQPEAMDFLTPQQRVNALAEILSTIALRIVKADHEQDQN